jgi:hypothetical protein
MCPRTTTYVSSYYYTRVLILLYKCPHTTTHVSSYYYMSSYHYTYVRILLSVLILLYMCVYLAGGCTRMEGGGAGEGGGWA